MHSRSICSRVFILVTSCRRPSRPSTLTALVEGKVSAPPSRPSTLTALVEGKVSAPTSRADLDGDSIALVHDPVGVPQVQKRAEPATKIGHHLVGEPAVAFVETEAVSPLDSLAEVLFP